LKTVNDIIINERAKTTLKTEDFFYELPEELIAQSPSPVRDECRFMVLDREKKSIEHKIFKDVTDYLRPGDMLVINSSKVIPARLLGKTDKTGSDMELLLLRAKEDGAWETLVRPASVPR
jgi:S-adenosylmethionine:tRNA ribosyltransferase-isomerase